MSRDACPSLAHSHVTVRVGSLHQRPEHGSTLVSAALVSAVVARWACAVVAVTILHGVAEFARAQLLLHVCDERWPVR